LVRGVGHVGVADLLRVSVVLVPLFTAGLEAVVVQLVSRGRRRLRQALLERVDVVPGCQTERVDATFERVEVISGHRSEGVKLVLYVASHGLLQLVGALAVYPHQLLDAGRHLFGGEFAVGNKVLFGCQTCLLYTTYDRDEEKRGELRGRVIFV
jgi:hypothetical protein